MATTTIVCLFFMLHNVVLLLHQNVVLSSIDSQCQTKQMPFEIFIYCNFKSNFLLTKFAWKIEFSNDHIKVLLQQLTIMTNIKQVLSLFTIAISFFNLFVFHFLYFPLTSCGLVDWLTINHMMIIMLQGKPSDWKNKIQAIGRYTYGFHF